MLLRILLSVTVLSIAAPVQAQWYASFDAAVATRTIGNDIFARNQTEVLDMMVGTGMFEVGSESRLTLELDPVAAGQFTIGHRGGEFGVEATYMTTDDWVATGRAIDAGNMLASPFSPVGSAVSSVLDNNMQIDVAYSTEMQSLQLNLTQLIYSGANGEATLLYGVRAVEIDEMFDYASINARGVNTLVSLQDNHMIGPQLGLKAWTPMIGGSIHVNLALAGMFNDIKGTEVAAGPGFPGGGLPVDTSQDEASLLGEARFEYLLQATPNVAVRIGYEFLGLSNVSLATNARAITNNGTDSVFYHYPYVGVVVSR